MLAEIIHTPYLTAPRMKRHSGQVFNTITDQTLQAKKIELEKYGDDLYGTEDLKSELLAKIAKTLNLEYTNNIINLALQIEEDIAIMVDNRLYAICFCFPSNWVPGKRLGKTFREIHEPVADNSKLLEASDKIMQTLINSGPYIRYVWTISNNSELSNHPNNKINTEANTIQELYFRYETQTTMPLPELNTAILFVNVQVHPLAKYWGNYDDRNLILNSINSMTDTVLKYKNLIKIKELLNAN